MVVENLEGLAFVDTIMIDSKAANRLADDRNVGRLGGEIVALFSAIMVSAGGLFSVSSMVTGNAKIGGLDRNCLHRQTTRKVRPSPIGHWRETGCTLGYASLNYCRGETFLSSSAFLEVPNRKTLRR